jgi:hypothetical protein
LEKLSDEVAIFDFDDADGRDSSLLNDAKPSEPVNKVNSQTR